MTGAEGSLFATILPALIGAGGAAGVAALGGENVEGFDDLSVRKALALAQGEIQNELQFSRDRRSAPVTLQPAVGFEGISGDLKGGRAHAMVVYL